jgi:hypothetical protein
LTNFEGTYTGYFEMGEKNGYGEMEDASGRKFIGNFQKNKPHG